MAFGRRRVPRENYPEGAMSRRIRIRTDFGSTKLEAMRAADRWLGEQCGFGRGKAVGR